MTLCSGDPSVDPSAILHEPRPLVPAEDEFPVLDRPPIVEVVCGFVYEPMDLDGMVLGVYWDERKSEYPERSLQPAFSDEAGFILGSPPLRGVLVSTDRVRVLQIQHDRLFMNWRSLGGQYPRFSNRGGGGGLLEQALGEFEKLAAFTSKRFGRRPSLTRIELAKIDIIQRQELHWTDVGDLAKLMPITGTFSDDHTGNREFVLRFVEHEAPKALVVSINSVSDQPGGDITAVRVETRAVRPLTAGEPAEAAFVEANRAVNRAFFRLLDRDQLKRFRQREGQV